MMIFEETLPKVNYYWEIVLSLTRMPIGQRNEELILLLCYISGLSPR